MEDYGDERFASVAWHPRRPFTLSTPDVAAAVVPLVGIVEVASNRLQRFEGLREGLVQIS
jgi:hypothetical protein